jgi:hypothetical protein
MKKKIDFCVMDTDIIDMFVDNEWDSDFKYGEYEWLDIDPDKFMYYGGYWIGWIVHKHNIREFTDLVDFLKRMDTEFGDEREPDEFKWCKDEYIDKLKDWGLYDKFVIFYNKLMCVEKEVKDTELVYNNIDVGVITNVIRIYKGLNEY